MTNVCRETELGREAACREAEIGREAFHQEMQLSQATAWRKADRETRQNVEIRSEPRVTKKMKFLKKKLCKSETELTSTGVLQHASASYRWWKARSVCPENMAWGKRLDV